MECFKENDYQRYKRKVFSGKKVGQKTPKDHNDCCWIHLKLNVRAARVKLFLSLCFRMLGSFSVYSWSSPEDKMSTFSIQNAKSIRSFKRFLFFKRQTWKWLSFYDSHTHLNCSQFIYLTRSYYFSLTDASGFQSWAEFNKEELVHALSWKLLSLPSLSVSLGFH